MASVIFAEGSGLNGSMYGKSELPIKMFLQRRGEAMEQGSMLKELFNMTKSSNFAERYVSGGAMEDFQPVAENGSFPDNSMQEGFHKDIYNEYQWMSRFKITANMVEDNKVQDFTKQPAQFMTAYERTREKFGAALYAGAIKGDKVAQFGGKTFNIECADGEALFSKNHPCAHKGPKQCNLFSDAFSAAALGKLETQMQNFRGDSNEMLQVAPTTILIPNDADLKNEVFAAIGADKDPVTSNNAFNYQFGRWKILIWNYLNEFITPATKPWVLLDQTYNTQTGGAIWQDRIPLTINNYEDKDTAAAVWTGRSRFNASFNDWRFAAIGGVSGGSPL